MQLAPSLAQTLMHFNLRPYDTVTGAVRPITARSLASFVWALVWAWLLILSFTGWGRLTGKIFRMPRLPASVACALGIASIVFLGGWLNLLHAIYPSVLFALTAIGLLLYVAFRGQRPEEYKWLRLWKSTPRLSQIVIVTALLVLALRVAATVRLGEFRIDDDGSGYLVFPQKMLAVHHFASDPFSDRRVISSLGGSYFLQAFVIAATSLTHIGMADRALGLVLIFFSLLDLGMAFGVPPPQIAGMELIAFLVPQEAFNLSFNVLPIALFLSMIWIIYVTPDQQEHRQWRSSLVLGIVGGGVLSLKSTFLPYMAALALLPYLILFWHKKRSHACMLPVLAGISSIVTVAAWAIAMKHDSGTYLFPILGHGVDYSSYNVFPSMPRFVSSHALLKVFVQGAVLLVLATVQYLAGIQDRRTRLSFSILVAATFAITAFNYESGGDFIWRYNFPQFLTAILVCFAAQAAAYTAPSSSRKKLAYALAAVCLICCIFYYDVEGGGFRPFREFRLEIPQYRRNLEASLSGTNLVSTGIAAEYRAVEAAVPDGAIVLDVSMDSFLFHDTERRRFLLDDWPGAASPPPGWPLRNSPEAVTDYLLHNSVRYLVYSYQYANWTSMKACQFLPYAAHFSEADEALQVLSLVTLHQFDQLRALHKTVYDDGNIAVVDLESPGPGNAAAAPNWTLDTSKTRMCTVIATRYIAAHPSDVVASHREE